MSTQVKLISVTKGVDQQFSAQDLIAFTARVSNPANQNNQETAPKLIQYLIKNKHWSPFEMVHMTVEIVTSRAIAQQILRHRSFSFQEFSQRYAEAQECLIYPARRQDTKNRQNSIDDMEEDDKTWFESAQIETWNHALRLYREALLKGIAKEQARMLLPLNTMTKLYMSGSARSWIHYLELRCANGTQLEHKEIAEAIKAIFTKEFPDIAKALEWDYAV
jgi:thymidylate synthase (FAD)